MVVRVTDQAVLENSSRVSEEILRSYFLPIDKVIASGAPKRPGYQLWVGDMAKRLEVSPDKAAKFDLKWQDLPATGDDVEFPLDEVA